METRLVRVGCLVLCLLMAAVPGLAQQFSSPQPLITQPIDESQLTTLKGNTHPLAQPQFDIGVAAPNLPLQRMLLVLKRSPQQDFALRKLLDDQQDKASPNYHKWLTPDEFGLQFGPSDQDVQLVTGWLQSHGFQVNRVAHGRSVIEFSGVEGQVESALHTQIHKYLVNGEEHWANASDPQIPAALVPAVAGVWSLHDFKKKPAAILSNKQFAIPRPGASPLITSNGQHALVPGDYATIYNINPVYSSANFGQGVNIAVIGRSGFDATDLSDFRNAVGLPALNLRYVNDGVDPGNLGGGEEAEAILDTTWSGAIAPGAQVDFVVSASTNTTDGVDLSELYAVDNNVGDVMTESFGSCEAAATSTEAAGISSLAEQAAAQGITYTVSTGDAGAEGCDNPNFETVAQGPVSVNVLASTQFNVAVGGNMFNENGNDSAYWSTTNNPITLASAKSYIPENVWNESCASCQFPNIAAGSGGASTFLAKPNWQSGVVGIPNDSARDLPDVSLTAAGHDPYLICYELSCEQGFLLGIAGTSASAPSFAGVMALVVQQYGRQGQADYVLYKLAAGETLSQCNGSSIAIPPASTCVFNDVTQGNNAVPGELGYGTPGAQYQAGAGYDLATGLGSMNVANLVNKWNTVTFTPTTTTLNLSPMSITHGQAITVSGMVKGNGGTPTGGVSLILINTGQSLGLFTLDSTGSFNAVVHSFPTGFYNVIAQYGGDGVFAPSSSATSPQLAVAEENSVTTLSVLTIDPNGNFIPFSSGPYGSFVYMRADVTAQSGYGIPTGQTYLFDNGIDLYPGILISLNSLGYVTEGITYFATGAHSLAAQYAGQGYFQSTSPSVNLTISPAPTTTTLTTSGPPQNPLITATIGTNSGGIPPTGTATLFANNTQIAQFGPNYFAAVQPVVNKQFGILQPASAVVGLNNLQLPSGQNSFTVQYSGDSNYLASTSAPLVITVQPDFTFSASGPSITIPSPGGSGNLTLTITGQTGYSGAVNFTTASCAGLPYGAQCSFNPASVVGTGTTTITVSTLAPTFASRSHFGWTGFGLVFAGVFLASIPRRRTRPAAYLSLILLVVAAAGTGCGGGGGGGGGGNHSPGTPLGTYPIIVTATSGSGNTAITHTVNFTLQVN